MDDSAATLRGRLEVLLAEYDRHGAVALVLDQVRSGSVTIPALYLDVLVPLMVDVGARWRVGRETVWEEHLTSASVRCIVDALSPVVAEEASHVRPLGRTVVLACPSGEHHDLGLRMLSDRFELAGWRVYFLGADVPAEECAAAAKALEAELVVLSASTHFQVVTVDDYARRLREALPGVDVRVTGGAFRAYAAGAGLTHDMLDESAVLGDEGRR